MTTENNNQAPETPKPKWDAVHGMDVLIGVPILWAIEIVLGVILVVCVVVASGSPEHLENHPVAILIVTYISTAVALLVTWLLVCKKYGKSFCEGFIITRVSKRTVLLSLALGIGYALIAALLSTKFTTGESMIEKLISTPTGLLCILILTVTLPPFEELYFRGFLFPALQRSWGSIAALLTVIAWFGIAHAAQLLKDPIMIPIVATAGAIFTIQRLVTKSLTAPMISHLTYNLCLTVLTLIQTATA
jgi:membrane protease YdiL (CAAX protease family)